MLTGSDVTRAAIAALGLFCSLAAQANPALPGGDTTLPHNPPQVFAQPAANLGFERRMDFNLGGAIFAKLWVSALSATTASDGLGPMYNARSCLRCHLQHGRGEPPQEDSTAPHQRGFVLHLSKVPQTAADHALLAAGRYWAVADPVYGYQIQDQALQGLAAEGRIRVTYTDYPVHLDDGETRILRRPEYRIDNLNYGPLHAQVRLSPRVAPPMIGLGLLEAITDADLLDNVRIQAATPGPIKGQVNHVWDETNSRSALGRFGWKARHPSIKQQNNAAFLEDIGISTRMYPQGAGGCTEAQHACLALPNGNSAHLDQVEASDDVVRVLTFYTQLLAVPARRQVDHPDVIAGEAVFHQLNCSGCHRPSYVTGAHELPELSNQTIWPYTDLLLHDMGPDLADEHTEFLAQGSAWRTPPLWGVGLAQTVNPQTGLLHDGRARTIEEAILWHGGEAAAAQAAYRALPREQRQQLLRFVESL